MIKLPGFKSSFVLADSMLFLARLQEKPQENDTPAAMEIILPDRNRKGDFPMKDISKSLDQYPETMNKEQMRLACHISKRTALFLLQYNLIPHQTTGKKTRCYLIAKSDVAAYLKDREERPEKYTPPDNWYIQKKRTTGTMHLQPPIPEDRSSLLAYYEDKLSAYPDVTDVAGVMLLTGYNRRTVGDWAREGKLKGFLCKGRYFFPKPYLLEWLCSNAYNSIKRKSAVHTDALWDMVRINQ